jgi:Ca2+-transporting ATPase
MPEQQTWHSLSVEHALKALGSDAENGLSNEEAHKRLEQYGRNELTEQPRAGFLQRLANQFKDIVIWLLIFAAIISAVLGEIPEAIAIILIVVLNAVLGVVQEGRAEQALEALKKMSAPAAHLLRGSKAVTVPEAEVVPGDIALLEAGNYIPADLRLIESANLQIDEASLTGESVPVNKNVTLALPEDAGLGDRKTMAYKSTIATYGRGKGLVTGTGMVTEIGKIAEMIQSVQEEETPLQRRLNELGKWLAYAALAICGLVFLVAFWRTLQEIGVPLGTLFGNKEYALAVQEAAVSAFLTAVALAVAAVPEGLPAIVTINLALGMQEMVKRHALIRRLPAVETLGSASAICSDKTGTLTQNQMTATRLFVAPGAMVNISGGGYTPDGRFHREGSEIRPEEIPDLVHLLRGALLSSDARLEKDEGTDYRIAGDPTEGALVVAAAKAGLTRDTLAVDYPRVDEIPFDSTRKRMSTLHSDPGSSQGVKMFTKGAPDVMLELCSHVYEEGTAVPMTDAMRERIANVNRDMAQQALRVLAVAQRVFDRHPTDLSPETHEKDMTFIGLVGMIDPARPEVKPAIERARHAGIKTVMVTGDYPETARAIAIEIGLMGAEGKVVTGAELQQTSDEQLAEMIDETDVFARVSPEHKVRIVDAFRKRDYVVAMTGDGVNDAPALKRASIGVAMGITGTDVSKETADMVLTDDNYVSIVNAVEQGRIIYDNIRKFVNYLLTCNLSEIAVIFIATLLGFPHILSPLQLLWLNLVTDGAPALALGMEKGDPNIMDRPPRAPNEPVIDWIMRNIMVVQTVSKTAVTLAAFFIGIALATNGEFTDHPPVELGSTMAFVVLSFSELGRAYTARSELYSVFKIGVFGNKWMQYAVGASLVLLLVVMYVPGLNDVFGLLPLHWIEWAYIAPLVFIPTVTAEISKWFLSRAFDRRNQQAAATA